MAFTIINLIMSNVCEGIYLFKSEDIPYFKSDTTIIYIRAIIWKLIDTRWLR